MNNKGFTLIELLAVVVLLALVGGIAVNSVLGYINTSKNKGESIFIKKLDNMLETYISLKGTNMSINSTSSIKDINFKKDTGKKQGVTTNNDTYLVTVNELNSFKIQELVNTNLVDSNKLINPKNKKKCFNNHNPSVRVFKDSDYVYYYYIDLEDNNDCEISSSNYIITNIPTSMCSEIIKKDSSIKC